MRGAQAQDRRWRRRGALTRDGVAYQLTLAALDTLAKLYDDPLSRFRFEKMIVYRRHAHRADSSANNSKRELSVFHQP
ncbi:hypothetical protein EVAR_63408_1 [Eumeta japonica]|uniref:Uncharacterized protein n=1 Tax=Eumeta variegata TaxID=151549 RepID=A0A4C1Z1P8_EUMVA|nr:hypothetical protein EVAR_63408_1 [Eumeta japonica]